MKHIPNILTIIRLFLVPIFALLFFSPIKQAHFYALVIFLIASITDFLDGYIARKYNLISIVGTVLDPLADKLMLLTALSCLYIFNYIPFWILLIIVIKEASLIVCGLLLYFKKEKTVIPSNKYGKVATVLFTITIFLLIIFPKHFITLIFLFVSITLKLIALYSYIKHYLMNVRHTIRP